MLSGHVDSSIDLWDLTHPPINLSYEPDSLALIKPITTVPRESPENHKYAISGINFFPFDSGLFTSSSYDKSVKVWDTNSLSVAGSFDVEAPIWAHAFSPVAEHCLIACRFHSFINQVTL